MSRDSELVTANELDRLGILKRGTAFKMAKSGVIPSYSVGPAMRGVRFRVGEVLAALKRDRTEEIEELRTVPPAPHTQPDKPAERVTPIKSGDMKCIHIKNGHIYVRIHCETKTLAFGHFDNLDDARDFRDKCHAEIKNLRFFPERYRKVGTVSGIPVVALRSHWISQRKEYLEWQRMKLQLASVRAELLRITQKS